MDGRSVYGKEIDIAFRLINALSETQRGQAVIGAKVLDLVLGAGQDGKKIQPEGLKGVGDVGVATRRCWWTSSDNGPASRNDAFAEARMAEIRANLPETYFAWSGPTSAGSPAYFRIQGPTLVLEFAPQEGTLDHVHGIYRDPTNDYGAKFTGHSPGVARTTAPPFFAF